MADGFGKASALLASLALVRKREAPDQCADADRPSRMGQFIRRCFRNQFQP
jgi:hypothetical protein